MKSTSSRLTLCLVIVLGFAALSAARPSESKADKGCHYALLVGVNKYDNVRAIKCDSNLSFAERDAQQLAEALRVRGFAADAVVAMTTARSRNDDRFPTAANIRKQVKAIAGRLGDWDSVVISFSGYEMQFAGDDDYYLCPADADADDPHSLVSLREVCTVLERAKGKGKFVIVDSCRSFEKEEVGKALTPRLPTRSVGVRFACSAGQNAAEVAEKRQGVLTDFVVVGLRGGADDDQGGIITAAELVSYVRARVPAYQTGQVPELIGPIPPIEFVSASSLQAKAKAARKTSSGPDEPAPPAPPSPDVTKADQNGALSPSTGRILYPSETSRHVGERVTVQFTVRSTGSNPAGFLELYSGATWQEQGSLFIRFPREAQEKFERLGIDDVRSHFARKTVRVTGVVQSMTFSTGGTHMIIVVEDTGQIEVIHSVARPLEPAPPTVPSSDETEFQQLFNGRDLAGWMVDGGDGRGWRIEQGEIVAVGDGDGNYDFLLSDRDFGNYVLRFDFKVSEKANSGVAVRAMRGQRVDGRPLNLEVQVLDDQSVPYGRSQPTGSLFWAHGAPLSKPFTRAQLKPRGEWNSMEVEAQGQFIRVAVNGRYIAHYDLNPRIMNPHALAGVSRDRGRIGLQRHTGEVRFRNVRVKQLPPRRALALDTGGHRSRVRGLVFTPDGQRLITVSYDKTIRIWDVKSGAMLRVLRTPRGPGPIGEHFCVALARDGKTLAVGGWYGRAYLIDLSSDLMLHFLIGHTNNVLALDFSPDGRRLATASSDKTVRIWDVSTGQTVRTLVGHTADVCAVRFSPDGRKVATGSYDKSARIFSADDSSVAATVTAESRVTGVDWSQDGQTLVAGTNENDSKGTICLWGLDGTLLRRFDALGAVCSLRSMSDGAILYTWDAHLTSKFGAVILDVGSGLPRTTFDKSWNALLCCDISSDGRLAATAGFDPADVRIWRTADGEQLHQLRGQGSGKWSAGWSADGESIAWGNAPYRDRPKRINDMGPLTHSFDLRTLQLAESASDFKTGSLRLDDLQIARGGDTTLLVKRGADVVTKIDTNPLGGFWRSAAWFDRERLIVGSNWGHVSLVDVNTGKLVRRFVGHTDTIWAIAPSPGHRYFLTASQDQTLRVWSPDSSSVVCVLYVSDHGEWVATAGGGYFAASPGGEQLMGWLIANGLHAMDTFYPASQFRKTFYRPDVVQKVLEEGNWSRALAKADAEKGQSTRPAQVDEIFPPKVSITSPSTRQIQLTGKTVEIVAVAQSVGANPVIDLRVMLDGRPVPDGTKTFASPVTGEARASWTIEVPPGSHIIVAQAATAASKGLSDPLEVTVAADPGAPKGTGTLYLLAIGINDYPDKRLKLDCAVPDAKLLRQAFLKNSRRLFPGGIEIRLLLDDQATRSNILDGLQWLVAHAKLGDVAVVSYAGHGDSKTEGQFYLVPVDANLRNLGETGISGETLQKALGELPSTTMLILDACESGGFDEKKKKRKTRGLPASTDAMVAGLIYDSGLVVMCGAAKEQEAAEGKEHGFFTQAIVEGLEGQADKYKTGRVEVDDLQTYVKHRVRELSDGEQEPTMHRPSTVRSFALSQP